ncbi:hypothetical protein [Novosphingobium sp.]|uniref:hypothetical protein n=1 Tax=Novosphingobium sp. TaxID=1874826 RepID=UPI00262EA66A|nr:hypothetical protein [Novosphingobium sp.]
MTSNGRIAALGLAAALAIGSVVVFGLDRGSGSPVPFFIGLQALLIVIGTVFEARYRGRKSSVGARWQRTGEREIDHETSTVLEVWYDPVTGERRYVPAGQLPG